MQSDRPMDRLLCGDVGFGKTEVALRAVMKCILAGKQAAILVPTTVLARQHYLTAMQRFQGHPITIELLTRYKTGADCAAQKAGGGLGRSGYRHAQAVQQEDQVQGSRSARCGRGTAIRRWTQGNAQGNEQKRGRAHAVGNADPAHAQHGAVRYPRYVLHRGAAAEPPSGADVRA